MFFSTIAAVVSALTFLKTRFICPFFETTNLTLFIRAKRVSNCYIKKKKCACVRVCVCSTNLGFSGIKIVRAFD